MRILLVILLTALIAYADDQPAKKPLTIVPEAKAQADALVKIKSIFTDDYAKHSSPDNSAPLIKELLDTASKSSDDTTAQFVLYKEAWRLAVAGGDVKSALLSMDSLIDTFAVDPAEWRKGTVDGLNRARLSPVQTRAAAQAWVEAADEALLNKDVDRILMALAGVDGTLRYVNDADFTKHANERLQLPRDIAAQYKRIKPALDSLNQGQKDPAADTEVGRFYCFYLGDWDRGLPLLCHCGDALLQATAVTDTAGGTTPETQVAIGDAWWDAANKQTTQSKDGALSRAVYWYSQAVDNLKGLEQARIKQRIASINHKRGIDLLAMINLDKDTLEGKWDSTPNGISAKDLSAVGFPYAVPKEYDLTVEATDYGPPAGLGINFAKGKARVSLLVGGFNHKTIGFELVKNLRANENNTTKPLPNFWLPKHKYTIVSQVRDDGITVLIDGKLACAYAGDYSDIASLNNHESQGKPQTISLYEFEGSIEINSVTLFEVSGSGKKI